MQSVGLLEDFTRDVVNLSKTRDPKEAKEIKRKLKKGKWKNIKLGIDKLLKEIIEAKVPPKISIKVRRFDSPTGITLERTTCDGSGELWHSILDEFNLPREETSMHFVDTFDKYTLLPCQLGICLPRDFSNKELVVFPTGNADWYCGPDKTFKVPVFIDCPCPMSYSDKFPKIVMVPLTKSMFLTEFLKNLEKESKIPLYDRDKFVVD